MRIIAYSFEADVHCPACTRERFKTQLLDGLSNDDFDQHWLRYDLTDREGNPVRPVFDIDEDPDGSFTHCGDCHAEL